MKAPVHLWIVGILSLLWNFGGAYDYVMTQTNNAEYLAQAPQDRLDLITNAPIWFEFSWAIGVWFSVLGSLLLLLRSRWAGSAFALSLLGLVVSSIYTYGMADGGNLASAGTVALVMTILIPIVLVALMLYARAMTARGVLR